DELTLLMARHDEQEERIKPWHIDSAASNNMTGEEDLFAEMEQSKGNVTFGDESKAPVKGKGKILIRAKDGSHHMLKTKKMPNEFWAEAVDCAVYLLNRCPSKSSDNKTPQEAWNGLKPTVSHLRVFGSIAYVHVPSQRILKLDDRSEKHVFVGYDKQSKGYKLYNPVTRKVVVSRDVEFDEEGSWYWSIQESERYDSLPMTDEKETDESSEKARQPQSPTSTQDSPSSSSEGEPKTRSLQELYEVTDEIHLICLYADYEPLVFKEAKSKKWRQAMEEEMRSIKKNDTWELTTLLKGQKAIGLSGYTRPKRNAKGEVEKYKVRIMEKGGKSTKWMRSQKLT
nr:retrovirus-related Pol polyprotein from transposon TNT 1-94 [Tanacetum cinerariifolium]